MERKGREEPSASCVWGEHLPRIVDPGQSKESMLHPVHVYIPPPQFAEREKWVKQCSGMLRWQHLELMVFLIEQLNFHRIS